MRLDFNEEILMLDVSRETLVYSMVKITHTVSHSVGMALGIQFNG